MSHFNKRHYEAIAQTLQNIDIDVNQSSGFTEVGTNAANDVLEMVRADFADLFEQDNSLFDRGRFLHACKPGSNVKAKTAHLKAVQS